ncbi:SixA phosphatase family protein [Sphingosinicella sp.]|uniref:SixA phosphatase family protein n=1 Tax=Sphingosinicella sp. TaxID=1917971 RepID=UPI004037DA8A
MKTLFLLRHAKSDYPAGVRDFDRPLNSRGRGAALAMGRELRRLGLAADHILASPAARVVETLALVAEGYGGRMAVNFHEDLYLAPPETLLAFIRETANRYQRLLIVGHNPGFQQLALRLGMAGPEHDAITAKYPTGALTEIELPIERWSSLKKPGRIVLFLRPRDLQDGSEADED